MNTSGRQTERIIRFDRRKLLLLFAPLAVLVGLSFLVGAESWRNAPVWVYLVFGGLGLFLGFSCLVLPRQHFLYLTPQGLTIQYLTSRHHYSWHEVRNFRVTEGPSINHLPTGRRVVFEISEDSAQRTTAVRLVAGINGYDASIMAWFNISAEDLADVLNEWQRHYGCGKQTDD
jgi:hypothetical protein